MIPLLALSLVEGLLALVLQAGAKAEEIEAQVKNLASIEKPDVGLSATMSGSGFLPLPSTRRFGAGRILIDHGLSPAVPLAGLVQAGPDALPRLLEALTDPTPTKLKITHEGFGAMWYAHEISGNPFNAAEMV